MKAIVVVFVRTSEAGQSSAQPLAVLASYSLDRHHLTAGTSTRTETIVGDDESPLWTWFVENPQPSETFSHGLAISAR